MIRFDNVSKQYAQSSRPALSNVDLVIEQGDFVFLVGSSGSGKSSLLRLMTREETPNEGRVWIDDTDLATLTDRQVPELRRKIGRAHV